MYIAEDGKTVECSVCGIKGELEMEDGKLKFDYPAEQMEHAHNLLPGKIKHVEDIGRNEGAFAAAKQTDEYKRRAEAYKAFIQASQARRSRGSLMAYFPDFRPMRSFILQNFRSDNDRPRIWRWLYKQHVPESISQFMPYCTKYCTYHALPLPEGAQDFGTYNGMMTEHYWLFNIFQCKGTGMPSGLAFGEEIPRGLHGADRSAAQQGASPVGLAGESRRYHPVVFSFAPVFWEDDFKGEGRLTDAGANFRWFFLLKYPDGVSVDEGDEWFKEVFAPAGGALNPR